MSDSTALRNQSRPLDQYKRAYKACLNCRAIKAKCVTTDGSETCLRCQRERRACTYPERRTVRKRRANSYAPSQHVVNALSIEAGPANVPQHRVSPDRSVSDEEETVVASSNDALHLLLRAAQTRGGRSENALAETPSREWSTHTLVTTGILKPAEAASYLQLFFQNLSPLSAIPDSYLLDAADPGRLIAQPLLCATLIMISSRYNQLQEQTRTRSIMLHDQIWRHTEDLLQQFTLGVDDDLRSVGTIHALLLMTDWHPRSLHMSRVNAYSGQAKATDTIQAARRSDQMSWCLLGLAVALAHELGIFQDDEPRKTGRAYDTTATRELDIARTQRLIYLYVTHLAIRLGRSSLVHSSLIKSTVDTVSISIQQSSHDRDFMVTKWVRVTLLLQQAINALQACSSHSDVTQNYSIISTSEEKLADWWITFTNHPLPTITSGTRSVLMLEYYHVRVCINSIVLPTISRRLSPTRDMQLSSEDLQAITAIRQNSVDMLDIAIQLHLLGQLRLSPVRVFLRIIAAAIFLLKVLSLPLHDDTTQWTSSLNTLRSCITALRGCHADDEHLSTEYSALLEKHVARVIQNKADNMAIVEQHNADEDPAVPSNLQVCDFDELTLPMIMSEEDYYFPGLALDGMDSFWNVTL